MNIAPITRLASRIGLQLQKHAPTIMTVGGIVGGAVTVGLAVKATTKADEVVVPILDVKAVLTKEDPEYPSEIRRAYVKTAGRALKLYGPTIGVGLASAGLILGAHGMMSKRNAALTAAYNAIEAAYSSYKARVVEELGEEKEREIFSDTPMALEGVSVNEAAFSAHPYEAWFEHGNPNWIDGDIEENLRWLALMESFINDRLRANGHVFLNEVRRGLSLEDTPAGAVTGWINNNSEDGDGQIDFRAEPLADGTAIRLNFNVDGVVFDKI